MEISISDIEAMGSDSLLFFGGAFEGGLDLQQVPDEIAPCLNDILESGVKIKNFLEIGSAAGGCSVLFDQTFELKNIVIIDDNQHPKHGLRYWNIKTIKCHVREFIGKSQTPAAIKFVKNLGIKFDIIMIDAGHGYNETLADVENYEPFLSEGGFILMHDIEIVDSVKQAFNEIKKEYKTKTYISKTKPICGIGVLQRS